MQQRGSHPTAGGSTSPNMAIYGARRRKHSGRTKCNLAQLLNKGTSEATSACSVTCVQLENIVPKRTARLAMPTSNEISTSLSSPGQYMKMTVLHSSWDRRRWQDRRCTYAAGLRRNIQKPACTHIPRPSQRFALATCRHRCGGYPLRRHAQETAPNTLRTSTTSLYINVASHGVTSWHVTNISGMHRHPGVISSLAGIVDHAAAYIAGRVRFTKCLVVSDDGAKSTIPCTLVI